MSTLYTFCIHLTTLSIDKTAIPNPVTEEEDNEDAYLDYVEHDYHENCVYGESFASPQQAKQLVVNKLAEIQRVIATAIAECLGEGETGG